MFKYDPSRKVEVTEIAPTELVTKGRTAGSERDLNLDRLRPAIKTLVDSANVPTIAIDKSAPHEVSLAYNLLRDHVKYLYERPEVFRIISDEVRESVANIQPSNVKPGTIGAYLKGFLIKSELPGGREHCSAIAAGAFPFGGPGKQAFCADRVMAMQLVDGKPILAWQQPGNSHRLILNASFTSYETFPGFSKEELEILKNNGIKEVEIMGEGHYDRDTFKQRSLTNGFRHIEDIKIRTDKKEQHSPSNGFGVIFFFGFLVIAMLLLFVLFKMW